MQPRRASFMLPLTNIGYGGPNSLSHPPNRRRVNDQPNVTDEPQGLTAEPAIA
jgi:hypothetical protein